MKHHRKIIIIIEACIVYAALLFGVWDYMTNLIVVGSFLCAGFVFSIFYAIPGFVIASTGLFLSLMKLNEYNLLSFQVEDYLMLFFGITTFCISAFIRKNMDKTLNHTWLNNQMLKESRDDLLSDLVSIDLSHRKFLEDTYFRPDDPVYFYHELRKQATNVESLVEFSAKLFSILNRYLFVESGIIYKNMSGQSKLEPIFQYGNCEMPEEVSSAKEPDWLKIVRKKKKIIISKKPGTHGLLMIIPLSSQWIDDAQYFLVIERIRFVMINPKTHIKLNVVSLIVKMIFERKLYSSTLKGMSISKKVVIFHEEFSQKILVERIQFFNNTEIDYRVVAVKFLDIPLEDREEFFGKLDITTRMFDEKFLLDGQIIIVFSFAKEIIPVIKRISKITIHPDDVREMEKDELAKLLS